MCLREKTRNFSKKFLPRRSLSAPLPVVLVQPRVVSLSVHLLVACCWCSCLSPSRSLSPSLKPPALLPPRSLFLCPGVVSELAPPQSLFLFRHNNGCARGEQIKIFNSVNARLKSEPNPQVKLLSETQFD